MSPLAMRSGLKFTDFIQIVNTFPVSASDAEWIEIGGQSSPAAPQCVSASDAERIEIAAYSL